MEADLRDIRSGAVADVDIFVVPRDLLFDFVDSLPRLLRARLLLLPLVPHPRGRPLRRRIQRRRPRPVVGVPVLRRGELLLLRRAAALRHGPADGRLDQRLVDGEDGA